MYVCDRKNLFDFSIFYKSVFVHTYVCMCVYVKEINDGKN